MEFKVGARSQFLLAFFLAIVASILALGNETKSEFLYAVSLIMFISSFALLIFYACRSEDENNAVAIAFVLSVIAGINCWIFTNLIEETSTTNAIKTVSAITLISGMILILLRSCTKVLEKK